MTASNLDPGHLTKTQVNAITVFAHPLLPVKERLALIKQKYHGEDVDELRPRLRMLVKDSARKLHLSNLREMAECTCRKKVAQSPSK